MIASIPWYQARGADRVHGADRFGDAATKAEQAREPHAELVGCDHRHDGDDRQADVVGRTKRPQMKRIAVSSNSQRGWNPL